MVAYVRLRRSSIDSKAENDPNGVRTNLSFILPALVR